MTMEQLFVARNQCFASHPTGTIPEPPVFHVNGLKYTVPPYYGYHHSETQWIVNMIKANNWPRIFRIITSNQCYLSNTYCQFPDSPDPDLGQPMFHRKAMLYLTPLALAIYLRQHRLATKMLEFVNENQERIVNVNQPCFVTNYLERFEKRNDIMLIYPFCIMFRRECFEIVIPMLHNGWCPQEEIELPYRRISQIFTFHYKDIIEYCLAQMVMRPNLRLPTMMNKLLEAYHDNFSLLTFENVLLKMSDNVEVEDFVSIPRRMLRYIHYYDRDMRILSQIISSLKVVQRFGFFVGPRRNTSSVNYSRPTIGNDEQNMINDQDNSIALILSICEDAGLKGHLQSRDKLMDLLGYIIVDTKWFMKFLQFDNQNLSDYFSNLTEKVENIKLTTIDLATTHLIKLFDVMEIDVRIIKELYDPEFPKRPWKENLRNYLDNPSLNKNQNCDFDERFRNGHNAIYSSVVSVEDSINFCQL